MTDDVKLICLGVWLTGVGITLHLLASRKQTKNMANLDEKLDNLEAVTTTIGEAIQTEIQQLKDAVAAGGPVSDAQFARLDALAEKLTGNVADLTADDVTDVS